VRWLGDTSQLNSWFSMQAGLHEEAGRGVPAIAYYAATTASLIMAASFWNHDWSLNTEFAGCWSTIGLSHGKLNAECFPPWARFTVSLNNDPQ
jgi:hypothetical protein